AHRRHAEDAQFAGLPRGPEAVILVELAGCDGSLAGRARGAGSGEGGGADGASGQGRTPAEHAGKRRASGRGAENAAARDLGGDSLRHDLSFHSAGWDLGEFGWPVRSRGTAVPTASRRFIFLMTTGQIVFDW